MKKMVVLSAIAAASLISVSALADNSSDAGMEKCHVTQAGKGMIVPGKADCKTTSHSCAGKNMEGDASSWIWVATGQCVKVNNGDFSGLSQEIQAKIEGTDASGSVIG